MANPGRARFPRPRNPKRPKKQNPPLLAPNPLPFILGPAFAPAVFGSAAAAGSAASAAGFPAAKAISDVGPLVATSSIAQSQLETLPKKKRRRK